MKPVSACSIVDDSLETFSGTNLKISRIAARLHACLRFVRLLNSAPTANLGDLCSAGRCMRENTNDLDSVRSGERRKSAFEDMTRLNCCCVVMGKSVISEKVRVNL